MKRIRRCRVCKSNRIKEFLNLGKQPYANSLLKKSTQKEKIYPLSLSYCLKCSLVQLNHTADPKELFSKYVWVTGTAKTTRDYAEVFCRKVLAKVKKAENILEVASNDGTFLKSFQARGHKILGIDPAVNIVKMANRNGIPTKCEFFGEKSAKKIRGRADVVIARNVLPHVANLHDFVKGLEIALKPDGLLVIEVHYAKKIWDELHYDSIYHEHLCYFTVKSLEYLLEQYGLHIQDIESSPISGGSIVVYARKGKVKLSLMSKIYVTVEKAIEVNRLKSWQEFAQRVRQHQIELLRILYSTSGTTVGFGASARSSTLLNYCGLNKIYIKGIMDENPMKQGLYTAGSHILIDSPKNIMKKNPKYVVILAWNFKDEIIKKLKNEYHYKGKYIIPLPKETRVV